MILPIAKFIVVLSLVALIPPLGSLAAVEVDLLAPPAAAPGLQDRQQGRAASDPEHFVRRGQIKMLDNLLASAKAFQPGDRLKLKLFKDKPISIVVAARETDQFGNETIVGRVEPGGLQTFTMTVNADDFVISLQDLATGNSYFVSGKTRTGAGEALEVDDRKRPRRIQ